MKALIALALEWSSEPLVIQSDCAIVLNAILGSSLEGSAYRRVILDTNKLLEDREFIL